MTYRKSDGSAIGRTFTTNTTGGFTDVFTPDEAGHWAVIAAWPGDEEYKGAYMFIWEGFNVEATPPDVESPTVSNVEVTPLKDVVGTTFTVTAEVNDTSGVKLVGARLFHEGEDITEFELFDDGGHGDGAVDDGIYGGTWDSIKASTGTYSVMIQAVDSLDNSEEHYDLATFIVSRMSASISCSVSPSEVTKGSSVTVSGSISPAVSDKSITLTYEKPDRSAFTRTVTSGSDGGYSDSYTPTEIGSWSVKASWEGDAEYEAASSQQIVFTVDEEEESPVEEEKNKGCIIATATYGSELSPEVQFLRGFRDNIVLNTFAGKNFMEVFNSWYYSFSPKVASAIAGNYALRVFMKILLYPLIVILHIAATTHSIFSLNPELVVLTSGMVASSLIGLTYFTPVALILCFIKKQNIPTKAIQAQSLIWVISIVCITIAEIIQWPNVMMFSTAILVLSTISLSILSSVRYLKMLT